MKWGNGKQQLPARARYGTRADVLSTPAAALSGALFTATASALARRKQVGSVLTKHTFGLRWKFPK
jgi:hypothetical protein